MTYLQLCQFVERYLAAGNNLVSNPMTTTVGQVGLQYEIVNWVQDAYEKLQTEQDNWLFRTQQGILPITPNGTDTLSLANIRVQISNYERLLFFVFPNDARYLRTYSTTNGIASSAYCYYIPYQRWRGWRDSGFLPPGQPQYLTELPNRSLQFYPISDTGDVTNVNVYNIILDYTQTLDVLTVDSSVPIIPTEFHKAIGWAAIIYWSTVRLSPDRLTLAKTEYERVMNDMRHSQLPEQLLGLTEFFG